MEPQQNPEVKKSFGPLIGIIVIVAVVIIGGLYFWKTALPEDTDSSTSTKPTADIDGIQGDLNGTATNTPNDFSDIDSQLK